LRRYAARTKTIGYTNHSEARRAAEIGSGSSPPSSREGARRDSRAVRNREEVTTTYNRASPGHPRGLRWGPRPGHGQVHREQWNARPEGYLYDVDDSSHLEPIVPEGETRFYGALPRFGTGVDVGRRRFCNARI
jgi:hypothetical protein